MQGRGMSNFNLQQTLTTMVFLSGLAECEGHHEPTL